MPPKYLNPIALLLWYAKNSCYTTSISSYVFWYFRCLLSCNNGLQVVFEFSFYISFYHHNTFGTSNTKESVLKRLLFANLILFFSKMKRNKKRKEYDKKKYYKQRLLSNITLMANNIVMWVNKHGILHSSFVK